MCSLRTEKSVVELMAAMLVRSWWGGMADDAREQRELCIWIVPPRYYLGSHDHGLQHDATTNSRDGAAALLRPSLMILRARLPPPPRLRRPGTSHGSRPRASDRWQGTMTATGDRRGLPDQRDGAWRQR